MRYATPLAFAVLLLPSLADAAQEDEVDARYVTSYWMNPARNEKTKAAFDRLIKRQPDSSKALEMILVPYFTKYISRYYRVQSRKPKIVKALDYLAKSGNDAKAAATVLEMVVENAREQDLRDRAAKTLASVRAMTIVGTLEDVDVQNRIIVVKEKSSGTDYSVKLPPDLEFEPKLNTLIQVTFDEKTKLAIKVGPVKL